MHADYVANCLFCLFEILDRSNDIDLGIEVWQQAIRLTPDDQPQKSARLNNLGISLESRFGRLGNLADINKAIVAQQQVLPSHPRWSS